jgi:hypothetical protein
MRQAVVCSSPGVVYSWYLWQGMGLGGTCSKSKPTPQDVLLVLESVWSLVERHTCLSVRACELQRPTVSGSACESASSEVPDPESCCIGPCLAVAVMAVVFLDDDAQGR